MEQSRRRNVVRGFSLVHDPEGWHYILEGETEQALVPGQTGAAWYGAGGKCLNNKNKPEGLNLRGSTSGEGKHGKFLSKDSD